VLNNEEVLSLSRKNPLTGSIGLIMTKKEWDKTSQEEDDVQVNFVLVRSEEEEDQIKWEGFKNSYHIEFDEVYVTEQRHRHYVLLKSDLEMDKFREWISKADEEKLIDLMSDGKHESGKIMSKPHDKDEKDKFNPTYTIQIIPPGDIPDRIELVKSSKWDPSNPISPLVDDVSLGEDIRDKKVEKAKNNKALFPSFGWWRGKKQEG
jgi:hypothetical protein|tara:strand:+ start:212 stop:829 length:618 start_codon:yes stop_codon:yes gene_type:complete